MPRRLEHAAGIVLLLVSVLGLQLRLLLLLVLVSLMSRTGLLVHRLLVVRQQPAAAVAAVALAPARTQLLLGVLVLAVPRRLEYARSELLVVVAVLGLRHQLRVALLLVLVGLVRRRRTRRTLRARPAVIPHARQGASVAAGRSRSVHAS